MKGGVPEPEPLLSAAQAPKILDGPGNHVGTEEHDDAADGGLADLDVEVHLGVLARLLQFRLKMKTRSFS